MKSRKTFVILTILIIFLGGAYLYYIQYSTKALPSFINGHTTNKKYIIEKAGRVIDCADTVDEAIKKAKKSKRSIAINTYNDEWVYSEFKPFMIMVDNAVHDFDDLKEAVHYAKVNGHSKVYYKNKNKVIWTSNELEDKKVELDVPLIRQGTELPRGCEVTSLAMIMKYAGQNISKMTLASEIKKEKITKTVENGKIKAGNPYDGFVGDMYNWDNFGYGVYHGPIAELARNYFGDRVVDLTGLEFEEVLYILQQGYPVWIITNGTYRSLDDSKFQIWHTPTGIVKITYKLHSVVMTGMTKDKIIINDPGNNGGKNLAFNRLDFKKAWEQMGNQAIVILD